MTDDLLIRLRELATVTGAPTWIASAIVEVEDLRARVDSLERETEELREQLSFYHRRVAA